MEKHKQFTARVLVMLATHNGARWIDEQLNSIQAQEEVEVSLLVSDDRSLDDTIDRVRAFGQMMQVEVLPSLPDGFGSANANFLRVVRDAPLGSHTHFAFADQDDVWFSDKLARATKLLDGSIHAAYSSDVVALWPNGRTRKTHKAGRARMFDHLFESAGPGCTFVFKRSAFVDLQRWVRTHYDRLRDFKVHDWLIYAYARRLGWSWYVDPVPTMEYRQHASNSIGVNFGVAAWRQRFLQIVDGTYKRDILAVGTLVEEDAELLKKLQRLSLRDRVWLCLRAGQCRRRSSEAMLMAVFFFLMPSG
jgi:rhamnosyltransferase